MISLSDLPPELLIRILILSDITTVARFRSNSRQNDGFVRDSLDYISRLLCYSHGYTKGCTASAASGVFPLTKEDLNHDDGELERAIKAENCQLSSSKVGNKLVDTWEGLARRRWIVDRNWLNLTFTENWIKLPSFTEFDESLWRFKLDPEGERIVTTSRSGKIESFSVNGDLISTINPTLLFPHIELSEGYFMVVVPHFNGFHVYRRASILEPPSPLDSQTISDNELPSAGEHRLYSILTANFPCQASKARFPYFVASSSVNNKIYLFNYVEGSLMKSFDCSAMEEDDVRYLELDAQYIYIAIGSKLWNLEIESGQLLQTHSHWPMPSTNDFDDRGITAMHYDTYGNYIIAYERNLLWTFRDLKGVVQSFEFKMIHSITQISVENGRVIFLTLVCAATCSLWLINLNQYRDASKWDINPPRAQLLVSTLPCLEQPQRIEMTNDQIFIPCSSLYAPQSSGHALFKQSQLTEEELLSTRSRSSEKVKNWNQRRTRQNASRFAEIAAADGDGDTDGFFVLNFNAEI